jgi:hypothetical protein
MFRQGCGGANMSADSDNFDPAADIRLFDLSGKLTIVTAYFHVADYQRQGIFQWLSAGNSYRQVKTGLLLLLFALFNLFSQFEDESMQISFIVC